MEESTPRGRRDSLRAPQAEDEGILPTRSLELFGRKVTATANHLIGDSGVGQHYQNAMGEIHRELRNPLIQRNVFSISRASPRELVRSKISPSEIQHRALTYLSDDLLRNIPDHHNNFSLFQGFQATLPEAEKGRRRKHGRHGSRTQRLLEEHADDPAAPASLKKLRNQKDSLEHRLEMMEVRKNLCSTEIKEVDNKIVNLNNMRKIVLERLADLEQEEADLEQEMHELDDSLETMQEELEDAAALSGQKTPTRTSDADDIDRIDSPATDVGFMSESIYQKLPSPKSKRPKPGRRKTNFILHEHLQAGSKIREFPAHNDPISALDFDVPFGTMVTAALDDTVRVWDLNAGRCMGLLEGHLSSVRCLQVEDNLVATGSMDATVRLWDLSQADYTPPPQSKSSNLRSKANEQDDEDDDEQSRDDTDMDDHLAYDSEPRSSPSQPPSSNTMRDCPLHTLSAHVAEITALHLHNNTLVSGSADKTLRQWDIEKGRCVQTLDVLWAAAQASASISTNVAASGDAEPAFWKQPGRSRAKDGGDADFVGALQCFDAALACGTADGMVRLWDLRSGQVHRSLVGHTGAVTCLQFDERRLVTGSADRSIRIWDLRTGSIYDAYAYDQPVTSLMFDAKSIAAAAGESSVKVYDKTDGRHWDCGGTGEDAASRNGAIVERVRLKDGYLVEGRRDGTLGVWSC
ncbi:MAG: Mitochondrial fission protein [Chrysothrix sp. TS-e1954]|nr:MAG: Mitochondrial fission protein [Chrysothrix sp. TS-e1954]